MKIAVVREDGDLSNVILTYSPKEPDAIGTFHRVDALNIKMLKRLLKATKVPYELTEPYDVVNVRPLTAFAKEKMPPTGTVVALDDEEIETEKAQDIVIRGKDNIGLYLKMGGMLVKPASLANITFKYNPMMRLLSYQGDKFDDVKKIFDEQGIKYGVNAAEKEIIVANTLSQAVVAASGGRFNGSHELLRNTGWTDLLTH